MAILIWSLIGLLAGVLTRLIVPGDHGLGTALSIIFGVGGAVLGGLVTTVAGVGTLGTLEPLSILAAFLGALLLVLAYRVVVGGGRGA